MSRPLVIAFTPVPLRARADGWTPDLQLRFILLLSQGLRTGDAARSVGKNRQNAYALRKRPGAESFAAAWDSAVAFARSPRLQPPSPARKPPGPSVGAPDSPPRRPPLPLGAEALAIAERGNAAVGRASSPAEARRALTAMLDALYGPKSDNSDNSDRAGKPPMGS